MAHLSIQQMFWVYLKILSIPKNLRTLKTNFEEADGLGISFSAPGNDTQNSNFWLMFTTYCWNFRSKLPFCEEVVELIKWEGSSMPDGFVFEFHQVTEHDVKKETVELSLRPQICNNDLPFGDCQANVDENVFVPCINKSMNDAQDTG